MAALKDKVSTAIENAAKRATKTTHTVVDKSKPAVHESGKTIEEKGKRLQNDS